MMEVQSGAMITVLWDMSRESMRGMRYDMMMLCEVSGSGLSQYNIVGLGFGGLSSWCIVRGVRLTLSHHPLVIGHPLPFIHRSSNLISSAIFEPSNKHRTNLASFGHIAGLTGPTIRRPRTWNEEVEDMYRLQSAGWKTEEEYELFSKDYRDLHFNVKKIQKKIRKIDEKIKKTTTNETK